MTAPYSLDLRERALARKASGETNREIAAALKISPSCVSKWTTRRARDGLFGARPDRRLQAADAVGRLRPVAARADRLWTVHAARPGGRAGRAGDQDPPHGRSGCSSTPRGSASKKTLLPEEQTRPDVARKTGPVEGVSGPDRPFAPGVHRRDLGEDQHGAPARLGSKGPAPEGLCALWPLEDPHLHRRPAPRPHRRALRDRRPDQRRTLPPLCREDPRPDALTRRCRRAGQPRKPQRQSRPRRRQSQRRSPALPAALQPRPRTRSNRSSPSSNT